ncbi:MAG: translation initiation factor IF-2 associated domain-containing protein, partial [Steroidobacterales bacterium]
MADVTVAQFAEVLKVPVEKLMTQLDQAGIKVAGAEDRITDEAKMELLSHLRRSHGQAEGDTGSAPRKITLRRKSQTEIKMASTQGRARTVNVEVRRQRTYVKRDVLEEQVRQHQVEIDKAREAEDAVKREAERLEQEKR